MSCGVLGAFHPQLGEYHIFSYIVSIELFALSYIAIAFSELLRSWGLSTSVVILKLSVIVARGHKVYEYPSPVFSLIFHLSLFLVP